VHLERLSYFSRLSTAEQFQRQALVETHRCGVENAQVVAAVNDGAEWIQSFIDYHRPDAVRILDFPHAAGYVSQLGQASLSAESAAHRTWLTHQLHTLKHEGPEPVLAELRTQVALAPASADALRYLEKRQAQMAYPTFRTAGLPIASGSVESGNKLVVEARLKGSGMHWARAHVDPMLALRNVVCSDRWQEAWPYIAHALRRQARRSKPTQPSQTARTTPAPHAAPPAPPLPPDSQAQSPPPLPTPTSPSDQPAAALHRRPPANHPWRLSPIGKNRYASSPKL
jgi:hypothetical protein